LLGFAALYPTYFLLLPNIFICPRLILLAIEGEILLVFPLRSLVEGATSL